MLFARQHGLRSRGTSGYTRNRHLLSGRPSDRTICEHGHTDMPARRKAAGSMDQPAKHVEPSCTSCKYSVPGNHLSCGGYLLRLASNNNQFTLSLLFMVANSCACKSETRASWIGEMNTVKPVSCAQMNIWPRIPETLAQNRVSALVPIKSV